MAERTPIDNLIDHAIGKPEALARLVTILADRKEPAAASRAAQAALRAQPEDPAQRAAVQRLLNRAVPKWHFGIVRDGVRNAAYDAALQRAVTPQSRVFEVGVGTGILSMMAARAGAQHVYGCEMTPVIAAAAARNVERNGYADRVTIIPKKSFDLDVEQDLHGRIDVCVSEIVCNKMLTEGVLPVMEHVVADLLAPGGRVIPGRGIVRVALAHHPRFDDYLLGEIDGFDLSAFNRLAPISHGLDRGDAKLRLASAPADLFDFDFQSGGPFPEAETQLSLTATGGPANGIVQWIALQMDDQLWYENAPEHGATSCWAVNFWPFTTPRDIAPGTVVPVGAKHNRETIWIWS